MTPTSTLTNRVALDRHKIDTDGIEHLDEQCPVLTTPQSQGDVLILPMHMEGAEPSPGQGERIPAAGITVVRGETTGGNAHILHMTEGVGYWQPAEDAAIELTQGWLTVAEGGVATMIHTQEHNVVAAGPGTYEIRRQREFAGEWRRVSD